MCRWLAYHGSPIAADVLLTKPEHSLIDQSFNALHLTSPQAEAALVKRQHDFPTNGEGFGVAWKGRNGTVGRFRSTAPAWNSVNLRSLASQIESNTVLAHVRADPGGTTSEQNCHPFVHGKWMFQHNGTVGGFFHLKRELTMDVDPDLYPYILGNTDSEVLFYLALTYGLDSDPVGALRQVTERVETARSERGIAEPFRATIAASDGESLTVMRTSSTVGIDESAYPSPTLFFTTGSQRIPQQGGPDAQLPPDAALVVSEPLSLEYSDQACQQVPDHSIVSFSRGQDPVVTGI